MLISAEHEVLRAHKYKHIISGSDKPKTLVFQLRKVEMLPESCKSSD